MTFLNACAREIRPRRSSSTTCVGDEMRPVRWSRDHRVALAVTLIERILPPTSPGGTALHDVTRYYLQTLLALDDVSGRVRDAGEMSVHTRISANHDEPFVHANEIVTHRGRNRFVVHSDRVVARIDELLAHAEPGTMEARMLAEVKTRMADGPTALAWLVECEARFERLLARASTEKRNHSRNANRCRRCVFDRAVSRPNSGTSYWSLAGESRAKNTSPNAASGLQDMVGQAEGCARCGRRPWR